MLLSEILKQMEYHDYKIVNEQIIKTLALVASDIKQENCIFLDDEKYAEQIKESVTMVITTESIADKLVTDRRGVCIVAEPRILFFMIHNYMANSSGYAREKEETRIGRNCEISPLAVIAKENVIIGDNVRIEEFAIIRENTVIGANSIIRAGAKIGGQGFEFKRKDDTIMAVEHCGGVVLGENVEIQYNSCIDKAIYPWDNTIIGDNTKIDNLVHVGHAVKTNKNVMIVANSGIGGRVEIDKDTWIGFGATIRNGVKVGKGARANMGAVVTKDIADFQNVTGNFAIEHGAFIRNMKNAVSLPEGKPKSNK